MFEELVRFREAFALEGEGGLVFFEDAVDGGRAYGQEFFPDGEKAMKGICWRMRRAKSFPHLCQKKTQMKRREAMASSA